MNASLRELGERLVADREVIRRCFRMEDSYFYPVCANIFVARGVEPDAARLTECRDLIKAKTGILSNFRGHVRLPVICLLSMEADPAARLDRTLDAYRLLKDVFFSSEYLAMAAWFISDRSADRTAEAAVRTRELYERMTREHRFLTGPEVSVYAALLALSD